MENLRFYIWVDYYLDDRNDFTSPLTHAMNKKSECKDHQIYYKMLRKICNLSFLRVMKNSSFDQCFQYVYCQNLYKNSLVTISSSRLRTSLVSSTTLQFKTQNILTMSMLVYHNKNSFLRSFSLWHWLLICSVHSFIKVVLCV